MQAPAAPTSKALYLRVLKHVRPHWRAFSLGILAMIGYAATETALPALLKELLDGSFVNRDPAANHRMPLLIVALFVVRGATDFVHVTALNAVATKVVMELRTAMFDKLLRLPASHFDREPSAALISKLTYNTQQVSPIITVSLITIVKDSLIVLGLLGYMLYQNWQLSLAFFTVLPAIAYVIRSISGRLRALSHSQQSSMGTLSHVVDEVIAGHREIKIFAGEAYEVSDGPVPFAWRSDLGEGRGLVGFLNWGEAPRWVVAGEYLRPGEVAFDVWNAKLLGMGDTLLQPHEGAIWQVAARAKTPRVVGDSASLTYAGLFQRQVSGRIQVRNDLPRPRVIAIEARGQVFEAELESGEMRWFD